ncbi:MAG: lysylphosphatidylglycerol synthase transmembrane domain-containing protein [Verrucomicrobiota bacterium]
MITKSRLTWALRWLVSVGMLLWILTRPEVARLGADMRHLDLVWLLGGLMCAGLSLALGAWRWQACLEALGMELSLWHMFKLTLAASALGCVSVGSLGADLAKVMLTERYLPGRHGGILASLALDHMSAFPCVVVMVAAATVTHGTLPHLNASGIWLAVGVAAVVVAAMAVISWKFKPLHYEMKRIALDRASWRGLLRAGWRSVPVWLSYCGIFYCAARAVGVVVPVVGFAGVIAIADGVAALPVTIAGLGVREQAFRVLLGNWYHVPAAAAVALSLSGFSLSLVWAAVGALGLACGSLKPSNPATS